MRPARRSQPPSNGISLGASSAGTDPESSGGLETKGNRSPSQFTRSHACRPPGSGRKLSHKNYFVISVTRRILQWVDKLRASSQVRTPANGGQVLVLPSKPRLSLSGFLWTQTSRLGLYFALLETRRNEIEPVRSSDWMEIVPVSRYDVQVRQLPSLGGKGTRADKRFPKLRHGDLGSHPADHASLKACASDRRVNEESPSSPTPKWFPCLQLGRQF